VPLDQGTEIQERGVDVRHPRQVLRVDGGREERGKLRLVAFEKLMVYGAPRPHDVDEGSVPGALEGVRLEKLVVPLEIKGKRVEPRAVPVHVVRGDSRDDAGVDAAGEEGTNRHVGDHLAPYGVAHKPGDGLHRLFVTVGEIGRAHV
jgi:hypothetical protein